MFCIIPPARVCGGRHCWHNENPVIVERRALIILYSEAVGLLGERRPEAAEGGSCRDLAVVTRRVWAKQLMPNTLLCRGGLRHVGMSRLLSEYGSANADQLSVRAHSAFTSHLPCFERRLRRGAGRPPGACPRDPTAGIPIHGRVAAWLQPRVGGTTLTSGRTRQPGR